MTATHSPGCPAIADVRTGCSCLLRQTSSTGPASSYPPPRVLPTSVVPARRGNTGHPRITGYSVAGVIDADPNYEFVWVRFDAVRTFMESEDFDGFALGRATGRAEALDAATEAVAALPFDFPLDDDHRGRIHKAAVLAAIAALKATP